MNLDPGAKTPNRATQHGDSFAVAMRLIMQRQRRQARPEPEPEVKPAVDAFGLPIENGHDTPGEPHERSTAHG